MLVADSKGLALGEGKSSRPSVSSQSSVSSSSDVLESGFHFCCCCCCSSAEAKMFLDEVPAPDPCCMSAAVRRGEREREAIDMGEGSAIYTSIGES